MLKINHKEIAVNLNRKSQILQLMLPAKLKQINKENQDTLFTNFRTNLQNAIINFTLAKNYLKNQITINKMREQRAIIQIVLRNQKSKP